MTGGLFLVRSFVGSLLSRSSRVFLHSSPPIVVEAPLIRGVSTVSCGGYATFCVLLGAKAQLLQAARVGDMDAISDILSRASTDWLLGVFDDVSGMSVVQVAIHHRRRSAAKLLVSDNARGVLAEATRAPGGNAFHFVSRTGDYELVTLLAAPCSNADLERALLHQDADGNTPLHIAVQNGHTVIALWLARQNRAAMFVKNHDGQLPDSAASSPRDRFELLSAADLYDVAILFHAGGSSDAAALRLCEDMATRHFLRARSVSCSKKNQIEGLLYGIRAVIFLADQASVQHASCQEIIRQVGSPVAKDTPKESHAVTTAGWRKTIKIMPIWVERVEFPPVLEQLLFRRQLVDFSECIVSSKVADEDMFVQRTNQLVGGVRKVFAESDDPENEEDDHAGEKTSAGRSTVFVAGDPPVRNAVPACSIFSPEASSALEQLTTACTAAGIDDMCVSSSSSSSAAMTADTQRLLSSSVLVAFLPAPGAGGTISRKTKNSLALAENHRIAVLPVAVVSDDDSRRDHPVDAVRLFHFLWSVHTHTIFPPAQNAYEDPAISYMLSKTPLFVTSSPAWAHTLALCISQHLEIAAATTKLTRVSREYEEVADQLEKYERWYGDHEFDDSEQAEGQVAREQRQKSVGWAELQERE
jgi:Ankyrin repeats (3 copies)